MCEGSKIKITQLSFNARPAVRLEMVTFKRQSISSETRLLGRLEGPHIRLITRYLNYFLVSDAKIFLLCAVCMLGPYHLV